jgi:hypothetical protein
MQEQRVSFHELLRGLDADVGFRRIILTAEITAFNARRGKLMKLDKNRCSKDKYAYCCQTDTDCRYTHQVDLTKTHCRVIKFRGHSCDFDYRQLAVGDGDSGQEEHSSTTGHREDRVRGQSNRQDRASDSGEDRVGGQSNRPDGAGDSGEDRVGGQSNRQDRAGDSGEDRVRGQSNRQDRASDSAESRVRGQSNRPDRVSKQPHREFRMTTRPSSSTVALMEPTPGSLVDLSQEASDDEDDSLLNINFTRPVVGPDEMYSHNDVEAQSTSALTHSSVSSALQNDRYPLTEVVSERDEEIDGWRCPVLSLVELSEDRIDDEERQLEDIDDNEESRESVVPLIPGSQPQRRPTVSFHTALELAPEYRPSSVHAAATIATTGESSGPAAVSTTSGVGVAVSRGVGVSVADVNGWYDVEASVVTPARSFVTTRSGLFMFSFTNDIDNKASEVNAPHTISNQWEVFWRRNTTMSQDAVLQWTQTTPISKQRSSDFLNTISISGPLRSRPEDVPWEAWSEYRGANRANRGWPPVTWHRMVYHGQPVFFGFHEHEISNYGFVREKDTGRLIDLAYPRNGLYVRIPGIATIWSVHQIMLESVLGVPYLAGHVADHGDHCGFHNFVINLCLVSQTQNGSVIHVRSFKSASGFTGVRFDESRHRWRSSVRTRGGDVSNSYCEITVDSHYTGVFLRLVSHLRFVPQFYRNKNIPGIIREYELIEYWPLLQLMKNEKLEN